MAVKPQRLLGNFRDAPGLVLGQDHVVQRRILKLAEVAQQEEQIGNGLKRIVDLVGDGGSQTSSGGQLFSLAQGFFAALAVAGVEHDDAYPTNLLRGGPDWVGAGQPGPRAAGPLARASLGVLAVDRRTGQGRTGQGRTRQFKVAHRLFFGKDAQHRVFKLLRHRQGQQLEQSPAEVAAERDAGHVGKHLVDAHKPATAVKEGQADGCVGQHRVQQRKRVVEPGALLRYGSNHAVEGLDQVADLVVHHHGQRKAAAVLR